MQPMIKLCAALLLLLSAACAGLQPSKDPEPPVSLQISAEQDGSLLSRFAPVFILEETDKSYNLIGTPAIRAGSSGKPEAYVDSSQPTIYATEQTFTNNGATYRNLIYRIHFEGTPYNHLTAGNNVGLLTIVTLNAEETPLLLTTVHTCGCYLTIIPTSALPQSAYPDNWPPKVQQIYGEQLPAKIDISQITEANKFAIQVRSASHRAMDVKLLAETLDHYQPAQLKQMSVLHELPFNGETLSFFETKGSRKGYVRDSHKPYERWLMSWWALDWRIGEDKDLGPHDETGTIFYTSLKPWARKKSDLWEFSSFLKYWGWKL